MPNLPEPIMGTNEAAELLGVKPATFHKYRQRLSVPEPDGHVSGVPWWWRSTIEDWNAARPGRGRWGQR